jgi:hypothetical protein
MERHPFPSPDYLSQLRHIQGRAVISLIQSGDVSHGGSTLFFEKEAAVGAMATAEWKLAITGRDAFGDVRRHEIHIDKSW